jgi:hypothetical protein
MFGGEGVYDYFPDVMANSIWWGNEAGELYPGSTVTFSNIQGGYPGVGNIDADPLFVNPAGDNYRLTAGSPCIDAGSNEAAAGILTDLDGNLRLWNGDDIPEAEVDMGAYEYGSVKPSPTATPTPTAPVTVTPTPTDTPIPTITSIPTPTCTNTATPTDTPAAMNTPTVTPTPVPGDTTGDGAVDASDVFFFSQSWKTAGSPANFLCDTDADGMIDEKDLFMLLSEW